MENLPKQKKEEIYKEGDSMDKNFMKDYLLNNQEIKGTITDLYRKHYVDILDSKYISDTNGLQRFEDFQTAVGELFNKNEVFIKLPKEAVDSYSNALIRIANGVAGTYKTVEGGEFNGNFDKDPDKFYQSFVDFTLTDSWKPKEGYISAEAIK